MAVAHAQDLGRLHISHASQFQEFRTHVIAERNPVERGHNQNQKPETAAVNATDQNHHVKHRERRPNFNETLHARIPELAEIALNTANHNAQEGSQHRQEQTEANANAESVNQAGQHVAAIAVGSEPMPRTRRKRRRSVFAQVRLQGVMGNRRHNRPNFGAATSTRKAFSRIFFTFAHRRKQLAVIGLSLVFSAKVRFTIADKCRKISLSLVAHQERFVINGPGARERQQVRHHKHDQRPKRTLIFTKAFQSIQGFLCQANFHATNLLKGLSTTSITA